MLKSPGAEQIQLIAAPEQICALVPQPVYADIINSIAFNRLLRENRLKKRSAQTPFGAWAYYEKIIKLSLVLMVLI